MEITRTYTKDKNSIFSKIIILGNVGVGKTSIIRRIFGKDFKEIPSTIGVEFMYLNIKNIDKNDPNITLTIQIWDTSGAERYKAITTNHIRGADGAYLVYDLSNAESFRNLEYWYNIIIDSNDHNIVIYLIGNKSDLIFEKGRVIHKQFAINFVKKHGLQGYAECSAKNNENIVETFKLFYTSIYEKNKARLVEKTRLKNENLLTSTNENENNDNCICGFL